MKILISDFDKTLFDDNYINNINKVNEFVKKGNLFVIATGRSLPQLKKELDKVNINYNYLICNDGGSIYDHNQKLINRIDIKKDIEKDIYKMLINDDSITDCFIDTSSEYTKDLKNSANAIIGLYNNHEKASLLLNKIETKYPDVHGYLSNNWLNIIDKKVSKDNAISYLINSLNIKDSDVITVGDAINDKTMIIKYNGYAMYCASDELKSISKDVVFSLEELINIIYEQKKEVD